MIASTTSFKIQVSPSPFLLWIPSTYVDPNKKLSSSIKRWHMTSLSQIINYLQCKIVKIICSRSRWVSNYCINNHMLMSCLKEVNSYMLTLWSSAALSNFVSIWLMRSSNNTLIRLQKENILCWLLILFYLGYLTILSVSPSNLTTICPMNSMFLRWSRKNIRKKKSTGVTSNLWTTKKS